METAPEEPRAPHTTPIKIRMAVAAFLTSVIFLFLLIAFLAIYLTFVKTEGPLAIFSPAMIVFSGWSVLLVGAFVSSLFIGYIYLRRNIVLPLPMRFPDQGELMKCWRDVHEHIGDGALQFILDMPVKLVASFGGLILSLIVGFMFFVGLITGGAAFAFFGAVVVHGFMHFLFLGILCVLLFYVLPRVAMALSKYIFIFVLMANRAK